MGIFDSVAATAASLKGTSGFGVALDAASTIAMGLAKQHVPRGIAPALNIAPNMFKQAMSGDITGALLTGVNSGLLDSAFPWLGNAEALAYYMSRPTPLLGGITPMAAQMMMAESINTNFAKKNLFLVSVFEPAGVGGLQCVAGGDMSTFNLFCTDLSYAPNTIAGDKHRVGAAQVDSVVSSEPIEFRITTLDDQQGSLKKWFRSKASAAVHRDGTVGVPAEYLVQFKIIHAFITEGTAINAHIDKVWVRPASIEFDLSRKDDALQELQMSFTQHDTFRDGAFV